MQLFINKHKNYHETVQEYNKKRIKSADAYRQSIMMSHMSNGEIQKKQQRTTNREK